MRKVFLMMVLLVVVSSSAMAEWVKVGGDNNSSTVYVNPATIRKDGNRVEMWSLTDFKTVQTAANGLKYVSTDEKSVYDCKEEQSQNLYFAYFAGAMGNGEVYLRSAPGGKWEPILHDSVKEAMWKEACRKVYDSPGIPPPDRIVLLPNADGSPSAVVVRTAVGEQVIDHPYGAVQVTRQGAITPHEESPESVRARYGAVLDAQPKRPISYIVYFVSGKSEIAPESLTVVDELTADMKTRGAPEIVVIGHTDRVGKVEANDALSLERAKVMRDILIATGISPALIRTAGRGEREPLVQTADEVGEAKNRRAEISIR